MVWTSLSNESTTNDASINETSINDNPSENIDAHDVTISTSLSNESNTNDADDINNASYANDARIS